MYKILKWYRWYLRKYNPNKRCKILIVSDAMIVDMLSNKKTWFNSNRIWRLIIFFITQSYFAVPKNLRLNSVHCFIMNISNKQKRQQIAFYHSSDIDFKNFMNLSKNVPQNHILF